MTHPLQIKLKLSAGVTKICNKAVAPVVLVVASKLSFRCHQSCPERRETRDEDLSCTKE